MYPLHEVSSWVLVKTSFFHSTNAIMVIGHTESMHATVIELAIDKTLPGREVAEKSVKQRNFAVFS